MKHSDVQILVRHTHYFWGITRPITDNADKANTPTSIKQYQFEDWVLAFLIPVISAGFDIQFSLPFKFSDQKTELFSIMPKNKKNGNDGKVGAWNGIASVAVSPDEFAAFQKWQDDVDGLLRGIDDLIENDYKLSVSYNNRNETFTASLSCYDSSSENYKYTLLSSAPSVEGAVAFTLWKHYELTNEVWNAAPSEMDKWR